MDTISLWPLGDNVKIDLSSHNGTRPCHLLKKPSFCDPNPSWQLERAHWQDQRPISLLSELDSIQCLQICRFVRGGLARKTKASRDMGKHWAHLLCELCELLSVWLCYHSHKSKEVRKACLVVCSCGEITSATNRGGCLAPAMWAESNFPTAIE